VLAPFQDYFNGAPKNAGIVIRVLPDDTMRGLELKKGSIDLVVNDLPPDIVHQFEGKDFQVATSAGLDYSYLGINMLDPGAQRPTRPTGHRLRHRSARHRRVPPTRPRAAGDRVDSVAGLGIRAGHLSVHVRSESLTATA
jgi:hypothetical protein